MNPWSVYKKKMESGGADMRNKTLVRERRYLAKNMPNSLSFHTAIVNGEERSLAIINSDNLDLKTLCTLPGEDLPHGGYVEWMGNHWIITEKDANNEVYTKCKMKQCNYLLRWVDEDNNVIERWCIIEDATKYLVGTWSSYEYVVERGDSRVYMYIPRDKDTVKLNRESRFLIDDYASPTVLAYRLTKPFKLAGTYNENGVLAFVLSECQTEDTDNFERHIANYYDHFPRPEGMVEPPIDPTPVPDGKKVWL